MSEDVRNLVVVRCGDNSIHKSWCGNNQNWDLAVSYFGSKELNFSEAAFVHRMRAGKWDGLFDFFRQYPECLRKYDYIWLPDDDLASDTRDINRLFDLSKQYELELSQPSLSGDSYFSHLITLHNSCFRVRYVNFVEIMAPLLSRRLLCKVLPQFEKTRTGFGLDFVWPRLTQNPKKDVAILDEVTVTHTRPVGGELHKTLDSIGINARDELERVAKNMSLSGPAKINNVPVPRTLAHAGITRSGRTLNTARATALIQGYGYLSLYGRSRQTISLNSIVRHTVKHLVS
jgi:hypothetical protein